MQIEILPIIFRFVIHFRITISSFCGSFNILISSAVTETLPRIFEFSDIS